MEGQQNRRRALAVCGAAIIFAVSYRIVWHNTYLLDSSDILAHIEFAMTTDKRTLLLTLLTGGDRMWHAVLKLLYRFTPLNRYDCACVATSVFNAAYYAVAVWVMGQDGGRRKWWVDPLAVLVLCLVGPLYAPWYSRRIYLGIGSPNIWHSPTQITVEPFALLLFALTVRIYSRIQNEDGTWAKTCLHNWREGAVYALVVMLSVWGKPSCIQIFVPGLGILMIIDLIRSRGRSFLFSFQLACLYIPGVILTAMTFVSNFFTGDDAGGLAVEPFVSWTRYTRNIPFAVFLLMAFPIFVYIMDRRRIGDTETKLSLSLLAAGATIHILLIEEGERRWHGNLGWGHDLANTLVWFLAMKKFVRLLTTDELPRREKIITAAVGFPLLFYHLWVGIYKIRQLFGWDTQY